MQTMTKSSVMGGRIKELRERSGLSLRHLTIEVCKRLPRPLWVSYGTIANYENGSITEDKADPLVLDAMAGAFHVPVGELSAFVEGDLILVDQLRESSKAGHKGTVPGDRVRTQWSPSSSLRAA